MNLWQGLTLAGATAAAAASWWLLHEEPLLREPPTTSQDQPDHFMERVVFKVMAPSGQPQQELHAERVIHFLEGQVSELTRPRLKVFEDPAPAWDISANSGWLYAGTEFVVLRGDVEIHRPASPKTRPITIRTDELRVTPNRGYAETEASVMIQSAQNWIRGVGMRAYFAEAIRLELLSEVRGKYELP